MTETNKWPPRVWFTHLSEKEIFAGKTAIAWPDSKNCTREYLSLSEHLALLNEEKKRGERLDEIFSNGCFTGDCGHDKQADCDKEIFHFVAEIRRAALENETKGE